MRTLLLAVVASTLAGSALAQTPAPAPAPAPQPVGSAMLKTADGGDAGMVHQRGLAQRCHGGGGLGQDLLRL